jgi:hypothetical protein
MIQPDGNASSTTSRPLAIGLVKDCPARTSPSSVPTRQGVAETRACAHHVRAEHISIKTATALFEQLKRILLHCGEESRPQSSLLLLVELFPSMRQVKDVDRRFAFGIDQRDLDVVSMRSNGQAERT